ncbi:uncharacterized protein LOC119416004 [Nematolebias whitei]|uniref:uncharacterized protein LOC119416004 n=1 Tax=Nematolebias whitei TaxID=451745 RepID=UPI00189991E6|nr:uncharacterized protein LOC119416004 [Nematolebias whitei]
MEMDNWSQQEPLNVEKEEAKTNTTPTSQPEEDPDVEAGDSTAATETVSLLEIIDETTSAPVAPLTTKPSADESEVETSDDGNIFGGKNGSVDSIVTPVEPDSGSGIPTSELDEKTFPKSVDVPHKTQMPTKSPNLIPGKGRALVPSESENEKRENHSSSDWLVVTIVILAVVAIFIVCVVAAKRKSWCGRKQTLMITAKDGGEGNGTAAAASSSHNQDREQEMVTLMNKENIQENGNTEEFTVIKLEESPDKDQQA